MNLYSTEKAGERLGMTSFMVARYCRNGRIEAFRLGRPWLITEENLAAFEHIPRKRSGPGRPAKRVSRSYSLIDPNGTVFRFENISAFCRQHGLDQACISLVLGGKRRRHRGWRRYDPES